MEPIVEVEPQFPEADSKLNELYNIDIHTILGKGNFSVVYGGIALSQSQTLKPLLLQGPSKVETVLKPKRVAIKCVPKSKLTHLSDIRSLHDEINILQRLNHENIITLYNYFDERYHYYLVTNRIDGGELFDRIVQKQFYNEAEARGVVRCLVCALEYLHSVKGIAHRDIKPENLLLVSKDDDSSATLVDFGFAKDCIDVVETGRGNLKTGCGTPTYVAPEVLARQQYGTRADMWSVGVTLYILLGGYPPFADDNKRLLYKKIRNGDFQFDDFYWDCVSEDAKSLISGLLTVDTSQRLTARQVLDSRWMCDDEFNLSQKDLSGSNLSSLKKYSAIQKLKASVYSIIAVHKFDSLLCSDLWIVKDVKSR